MRGTLSRAIWGLSAILALTSCSKFGRLEKGEGTSVTFRRSDQGVKRAGPDQLGGVIIWGESYDTGEQISFLLATNSATYTRTFKTGNWEFYAVGWEGGSPVKPLKGTARCAVENETFTGGSAEVVITLDSDCSDSFFGPSSFLNSAAFRPLRFVTCLIEPESVSGDDTCSGLAGDYQSFQLVMGANPSFHELGGAVEPTDTLTSDCSNLTGDGYSDSNLEIPVGGGRSSPIYTKIIAWSSSNCSGTPVELEYYGGLLGGDSASGMGGAIAGASRNAVFLEHGTAVAPSYGGVNRNDGGWGGGYLITITGSGFFDTPKYPEPSVTIGGVDCEIQSVTAGSITCLVGNNTDQNVLGVAQDIVVTNPDGQFFTQSSGFTYIDDKLGNGKDAQDLGGYEHVISSDIADTSTASLGSRIFAANRNVTALSIASSLYTFTVGGAAVNSSEFEVGDDVLWHVTAASADISACSSSTVTRGTFGGGRVTNVTGNDIEILNMEGSFAGTPNNGTIAATSRSNTDTFCVIQLVRVPNFKNLTLDTAAAGAEIRIMPPPFNMATGKGGIVAIRVAETYKITGSFSGFLSAKGKGFAGGTSGFQGAGRRGQGVSATGSNDAAGGSGAAGAPGTGGGGGAHEGAGGSGGSTTNGGGNSGTGCVPYANCAQMGAGGGGGATGQGGPGGGVALLYARDIDRNSFAGFNINANGDDGDDDASANGGGGGGGAGGTVLFLAPAQAADTLNLESQGGAGGDATGVAASGGGGGGGGTAQAVSCAATTWGVVPGFSNGYGLNGTGTAANGSLGGDGYTHSDNANRNTTIGNSTLFCPP